ncbi:MAG TPA: glycosyltransferase family 4 protein [Ignavibacteriaceae bacterium]|nr:glycosyltransferase family 4 protein [Ignavibacteriaceae bacterium]
MLNYEYPPLGGGAGRATQSIAAQLFRMGHNVDIVTSHTKFLFNEKLDYGVKIYAVPSFRNGIHDCGIKGAVTYMFFAYYKMLKLIKQKNYDVVHYFFSLPTAFLSLLPGKHRRLPFIVSLRGSDVPGYDNYNKKLNILHKLFLPLTKLIWKRATRIIAVTESLKKTALLTNPAQEIKVIPNGIDTNIFTPRLNGTRGGNDFQLITVSRLIERKGIQHVLKALAEIKDKCIRLLLIGEGGYENELRSLCRTLGLNNQVFFMGFRRRDTIPSYFAQSDVFILPSLSEAFGNVIAEAMACGLPIIGGNEGGIPDLVQAENGILVKPGDVEEIKSAIVFMKNNKEVRIKMGKNNILKMEQNYKWEKTASAYSRIYEESLNGDFRKN